MNDVTVYMKRHLRSVVREPMPMNDHASRTMKTEQPVGIREPIREMLEGLSLCSPGPEYFRALVSELARTLDAEFAFAAELAGEEPLRARTGARVGAKPHVANIEYVLNGTPCGDVVQEHFCWIPTGVAERYPLDL